MIVDRQTAFWQRVEKSGPDECWPWTGHLRNGYGSWQVQNSPRRRQQAHRVAYELTFGAIPAGMVVRHKCDCPGCCNPDHLEIGTQADNMRDMAKRGRAHRAPGEHHPQAKLTDQQVQEIRETYAAGGISQRALAAKWSVTHGYISKLVNKGRAQVGACPNR